MLRKKHTFTITICLLLAMFLATQVQAKGNAERGGDLSGDCIECHGMEGKGDFETPPIAGLKESYILKQLRAFNSNKRKSTDNIMHLYTEDRTDQELQDLAAFWASKPK